MKPKTLIVLIAALAACAIFMVLRYSYQTLLGPTGGPAAQGTLFQPAPLGATAVTVVSAEGGKLAFSKTDGVWRMVEPINARADRSAVDPLADAMVSAPAAPVTGDDAADALTGLDHPRWTVTLTDQRGRTFRLAVGRAAVMSGGRGPTSATRAASRSTSPASTSPTGFPAPPATGATRTSGRSAPRRSAA